MFYKIFCRVFQFFFNFGVQILPWKKAEVISGKGCISEIPSLIENKKAMVVSDPGLVKAGIVEKITLILEKNKKAYSLFSDVEPNPSVDTVEKIVAQYKKDECECFIAIGGGSSMDAAKAAAARIVKPKKSVNKLGGLFKVLHKLPLFIAVPTTSGTGSETTLAALITDTKTHHKYAIMDLSLIPKYAVLDPNLTLGLPGSITGTTGMDALTHAVEAYLCWTYNTKETKEFALFAVKNIFKYLKKAYDDGTNLEAREKLMLSSFKAGWAFTKTSVGNVHAIAHTLGGLYGTPHGLANAVILPIVLEDYGETVYGKLAKLADTAGITEGIVTKEAKAKKIISEIYKMNEYMKIPKGFDFIKKSDYPQIEKWATHEANPIYPVPVIYDKKRVEKILEIIND